MKRPHFKKLNGQGFHHVFIMAAAFIVLFGAIGTYFLITSHAATTTDEISNGNGLCINDKNGPGQGNTNLSAASCDQSSHQIFAQGGSDGAHIYTLFYNNTAKGGGPLCLSSVSDSRSAGTTLQADKCGSNDSNALHFKEIADIKNKDNTQLQVTSTSVCVDSSSGRMLLSNCTNAGDWHFRAKSVTTPPSGGGGSGGGNCSTQGGSSAADQTVANAQCDAKLILAAHNESGQYSCMDNIFNNESGWRWNAANASGAYGIPQSLPGSKMASSGSDWQTNPATQIKWGLGYMNNRYGSPCKAWAFWQGHHYYITEQTAPTGGSGTTTSPNTSSTSNSSSNPTTLN